MKRRNHPSLTKITTNILAPIKTTPTTNIMGNLYEDRIIEEDESDNPLLLFLQPPPDAAARSHTRRERINGLGISNLDTASIASTVSDASTTAGNNTLKPHKRRPSTHRSLVSLFTKSMDSQISKHDFAVHSASATPSAFGSHSRIAHVPAYPEPHFQFLCQDFDADLSSSATAIAAAAAAVVSPASGMATSPFKIDRHPSMLAFSPASSSEDLTTYHANLKKYRTERAARVAESGVDYFGFCAGGGGGSVGKDGDGARKSVSSVGLGRGLKAYWGGGRSSSDLRKGGDVDLRLDEAMERDALKEWWDGLGSEEVRGSRSSIRV